MRKKSVVCFLLVLAALTAPCFADSAYLYDAVSYSVSVALPFANTPVPTDGGALGFKAYRGNVSVEGTNKVLASFIVAINIAGPGSIPHSQRDVGGEFAELFMNRFGIKKGLDKVVFGKDKKAHKDFVVYSTEFVTGKTPKGEVQMFQANVLVDKKKRFTMDITMKAGLAKLSPALSKKVLQVLQGVRRGMLDSAGVS